MTILRLGIYHQGGSVIVLVIMVSKTMGGVFEVFVGVFLWFLVL
jgi:hypothetical protein